MFARKQSVVAIALLSSLVVPSTLSAASGAPNEPPLARTLIDGHSLAKSHSALPFVVPEGIAIREIYKKQVLVNGVGAPLYWFDQLLAPEAKEWRPALATQASTRNVSPEWKIVGQGNARQWSYQGKALYTFAGDVDFEKPKGDRNFTPSPNALEPSAKVATKEDGGAPIAHVALLQNLKIVTPTGIAVTELPDASGRGLTDRHGMTLYMSTSTNFECSAVCAWRPLAAPGLGAKVGEFSTVDRPDGVSQWTYKNRPLFTYDGDLIPGDVTGAIGVMQAALIERYFMPTNIAIGTLPGIGSGLTLVDGQTLYQRDRLRGQFGGRLLRRGVALDPSTGRKIGAGACDDKCLKAWSPVLAPKDARAFGYWEVVKRESGANQWSYKGYALYTYAGDERPGQTRGHNEFDLVDLAQPSPYRELLMEGINEPGSGSDSPALYWHIVYP